MGENQGMMWIVVAGLGVIGGTMMLTQSARESLIRVEKEVEVVVIEIVKVDN